MIARWPVLMAIVAVGALGCRQATTIDHIKLEAQVPHALVPDHPDLVTAVVCAPMERGIGVITECTATIGETPVTARVEQTNADGVVRISTDAVLVDLATTETDLATRLTTDIGVGVRVACQGGRVQVLRPAMALACTASDPKARSYGVTLTFTDDKGAYFLTLG
jgi:hypothetical protein